MTNPIHEKVHRRCSTRSHHAKIHNQHNENIGYTWRSHCDFKDLLSGQHHGKSHKDKVTEPERRTHVPAIPNSLNPLTKGLVKVDRTMNTHQV